MKTLFIPFVLSDAPFPFDKLRANGVEGFSFGRVGAAHAVVKITGVTRAAPTLRGLSTNGTMFHRFNSGSPL
jgi:hypothetical protein